MEQLLSWLSQSEFNMLAVSLVLGVIPFVIFYSVLKKIYSTNISTLIAFLIVLFSLIIFSLVINENPPYFHFFLGGILLIIILIKIKKK